MLGEGEDADDDVIVPSRRRSGRGRVRREVICLENVV